MDVSAWIRIIKPDFIRKNEDVELTNLQGARIECGRLAALWAGVEDNGRETCCVLLNGAGIRSARLDNLLQLV